MAWHTHVCMVIMPGCNQAVTPADCYANLAVMLCGIASNAHTNAVLLACLDKSTASTAPQKRAIRTACTAYNDRQVWCMRHTKGLHTRLLLCTAGTYLTRFAPLKKQGLPPHSTLHIILQLKVPCKCIVPLRGALVGTVRHHA